MKAKKSLGQNFLESSWVLSLLIETSDIKEGDLVLEVGPGEGSLTEHILQSGANVIAIEKDFRLIPKLEKKFSKEIKLGKLIVIEGDILKLEIKNLKLNNLDYKIVANIPYYITGSFLEKFLSSDIGPNKMVLMLQKEVAQRIVAEGGKESILSISVKAYGNPKFIKTVGKENFSPEPKVDSAILLIDDISKDNFKNIDEKLFFKILKSGFSHKRKFLLSNLKKSVISEKNIDWDKIFNNIGLNPKSRAENISLENWISLSKNISDKTRE